MPPEGSPVKFGYLPMEEDHHNVNNEVGVNPTMTGQESTTNSSTSSSNSGDYNYGDGSASSYHLDTTVGTVAAQTILFVDDPVSPGISSWLGAEVQVENKIARRCSYEEMVHEDYQDIPLPPACGSGQVLDHWYASVTRVTQWAITLQEVADERKNLANLSSKCLCHKAAAIVQKLQNLMQFLICEENSAEDNSSTAQDDLSLCVDDVQSALRAGVSIQISKPNEAVITKSSSVVDAALISCEKVAYVKSVIDSIVKLVNDLLHVPTCGHASNGNLLDDTDRIRDVSPTRLMEQDEEEDIRSRVASMFQESEEEDDDSDANPDSPRSARKRKQGKLHCHNNRNLTSPTSSPSKRARKLHATSPNGAALPENLLQCSSAPAKICQNSPALDLLESKKKVQRNSLYHWVLWREALRGEKDRVTTHPRRLSFN